MCVCVCICLYIYIYIFVHIIATECLGALLQASCQASMDGLCLIRGKGDASVDLSIDPSSP